MKVLSLFDGCAMTYQALKNLCIHVDTYYASEIDKHAIHIAQKNHPDIIQLGSVVDVRADMVGEIDLLVGGSPCQDLSVANKNREGLAGAKSGLFWEYVRILQEVKPKYFLLENVASMSKDNKQIITDALGVEPIMINSALLTAQNRKRLYRTNIPGVGQPGDLGLLIKDILDPEPVEDPYYINEEQDKRLTYAKGAKKGSGKNPDGAMQYPMPVDRKSLTLLTSESGYNRSTNVVDPKYYLSEKMVAGLLKHNEVHAEKGTGFIWKPRELDQKATTLRANPAYCPTDNCIEVGKAEINGHDFLKRVYSDEGKCPTLIAICGGNQERKIAIDERRWRKLTPVECERLQGLPDRYTEGVSNSQRYKMIGNGFTVPVISHILSYMLS